jgi:hypothetical protein
LAALSGFARVHDVDVVTVEHGEDPDPIPGVTIDAYGLDVVFNRPGKVAKLDVSLDLLVTSSPGNGDDWIQQAGFLELAIDEHTADSHTIGLHLSIDIDIYSPTTWGKQRDNHILAALNAPRLSKFLAIVHGHLGGTCDAIDAEDYPGLVDETGFRISLTH